MDRKLACAVVLACKRLPRQHDQQGHLIPLYPVGLLLYSYKQFVRTEEYRQPLRLSSDPRHKGVTKYQVLYIRGTEV